MKRFAWVTLGLLAFAACGGSDGDDTDLLAERGFGTPTETTQAWSEVDSVWQQQGPANFSCLNTANSDVALTQATTLTGRIEDFQTGDDVPNAQIKVFDDVDLDNPFATVTADENGDYSLELPAGTKRFGMEINADGQMRTLFLNQYIAPDGDFTGFDVGSVSELTANALPAFIGVTRTPGRGVLAGALRDCDDNEVKNAIATVSSVSGSPEFLDGEICTDDKPCTSTYYFSAGATSLPVRHSQAPATNSDGLFMTIELPPLSSAFLQVWGFTGDQDPATDDLTLLAEIPSPVFADTIVTFSLEPLRN